jgi:hypothetical protein
MAVRLGGTYFSLSGVAYPAAAPGFTSACLVKGSSLFFQERWQT